MQNYYPRAALATLSANELASLEKLKAIGFTVVPFEQFRSQTKDGKIVVIPPRGIVLCSPSLGVRPKPALTAKELTPVADLCHVERLTLAGKFIGNDTLELLRNMDELNDLTLTATRITDAGLKKLGQLKALRRLKLGAPDVTDAGMATLAALPALEFIWLANTQVGDAGVAALANSRTLQELVVIGPVRGVPGRAPVGDAGVIAIAGLPHLVGLTLDHSSVTDNGLAAMAKPGKFSGLVRLDLSDTAITDAALKSLHDPKALPALKMLGLARTQVTPEGVITLQKSRPDLRIRAAHPNGTPFESTLPAKKQ